VNKKQAKLLRYAEKHGVSPKTIEALRKSFDFADHKTKGQITKFLKTVIVTRMQTMGIR
jgi:hypothetical protein